MPRCGVVNTLNNLIGLFLLKLLDFPAVCVERQRLLLHMNLRPVNLLVALHRTQEVLHLLHVCTIGGLEVLQDAMGRVRVVQQVDTNGEGSQSSEKEASPRCLIRSNLETDITGIAGLFEALHRLNW